MRVSCPAPVLRCWVGEEYTVLPRSAGHRSGCLVAACLVRTLCAQRITMFYASARSTLTCGSRSPRVPYVCWPCCTVHGPYTNIPGTFTLTYHIIHLYSYVLMFVFAGASWKIESATCRLCGILMSQGHRALYHGWVFGANFLCMIAYHVSILLAAQLSSCHRV